MRRRELISRRHFARLGLPALAACVAACHTGIINPKRRSLEPLTPADLERLGDSIALVSYVVHLHAIVTSYDGEKRYSWISTADVSEDTRVRARPYMTRLRHHAESRLHRRWRVVPSATFIERPAYQELQVLPPPHLAPKLRGYSMRTFGVSTEATEKFTYEPRLSAAQARGLARLTGTELIAVVEVSVAHVDDVSGFDLAIYDRAGELVFGRTGKRRVYTKSPPMAESTSDAALLRWTEAAELELQRVLDL